MGRKVRLIDIAKKANVSLGTVDRVVNNRGKAAPKTEKLIRDIITEFGYEPNLMASSLSSKKKMNFAVLVPKPQGEDYWKKIHSGIESAEKLIKEFGVKVSKFMFNQDDDIEFSEWVTQILEAKYDGVLLTPVFHKESKKFALELEKENIPYVFIDSMIEETHPLCAISQNVFQSGALAAKLIDFGIAPGDEILSISHLSNTDNFDNMQDRSKGFKSFFESPEKETRVIHSIEMIGQKFEQLSLLLDNKLIKYPKIKGIFINNSKAHMVARYLDNNNISTMRLVGFDLIEPNINYLKSGIIDFILFDYAENQGEIGLQILFDKVLKKKKTAQRINMPINIVTKENLDGFL